ncbi:MAG TPA: MFS transporter, partial [Rhizomicrobium sp.]|nr:MFS transporter [Rhizomicrobium sp.]
MAKEGMTHRRWIIGVLLGTGVLVNYIDRISLSVAAPQLQHDFGLTPQAVGFLFSAFFWSYSLAQLPGGLLLD